MKILIFLLAVTHAYQEVTLEDLYQNKMRSADYDYIVVGAGTSGSVVASRLSEDPSTSVLLLEAGGLPNGLTEVPLLGIHLLGTELDWTYYSEPQEHACQGMKNKQAYLPRGKVLGGSSSVNSMLFVRGDKRDFDEWAQGGATGWSWDDVLYYFKKLEDLKESEFSSNGLHATGGPQTVEVNSHQSQLGDAIFEAAKDLGYDIMDVNAESLFGFAKVQGSVRKGRRCSTEKGYLRPALTRKNLDILYNAHVTKILFDQDKRATAVRFEQKSASHVVRAKKEIIVSGGAFGTPQILLLSGIGPKAHLEELGIPVIADLPVGENLQDHVMVGSQVYKINSSVGLLHTRVITPQAIGQFLDGKGPLTVPLTTEAMAAINSKYQDPAEQWPDIRLFFGTCLQLPSVSDEGSGKGKVQFYSNHEGLTINPQVCRPKSVGFVKLRSTNPFDQPIIDPKYLSHEYDVKVLVESMRFAEQLVKKPSIAQYNPVRTPQVVPGCEDMDTDSEKYLTCVARTLSMNGFHHCCTAKMGRPDDPTTVVDPELRVKGVKGLRVADASIMPAVTSGNTMAPCIMIGEKAADLIRGRHWDPVEQRIITKN